MAKAADQHTPIKDLNDLLRYLTEDLGYRKGFAAYVMNQCYLDGQLQLEKQECVRDGEPYGDAVPIDPEFGYIELDPHGRVRIAPRIKLWREVRYRIAEGCDVRTIWPPRPPASQTEPDRQQDERLVRPAPSTPMAALPSSHEPTAPSEKPKETSESRLINVMKDIGLEKSGLLPREVRKKVRPQFLKKYPNRDVPAASTFNRAYQKYIDAKDTSAE